MSWDKISWFLKVSIEKVRTFNKTIWTKDRLFLEYKLFYHLRKMHPHAMLMVGVSEYTKWYSGLFPTSTFHTIDPNIEEVKHGNGRYHTVGRLAKANAHFEANAFDVIIFNGVYGWGLDTEAEFIQSMQVINTLLKKGGILIFGYNRTVKHDPLQLSSNFNQFIKETALVESTLLGPPRTFKKWLNHTYYFMTKA